MAHRIEVAYKEWIKDVPGEKLKKRIKRDFGLAVDVHVADVYTVDADVGQGLIDILSTDAFIDPVTQTGYTCAPTPTDADWAVEVGYKPGVTDNVARTAREVIEALSGRKFKEDEGVYTSRLYFLKGGLDEEDVRRIAEGMLANTLINRYAYKTGDRYMSEGGMGVYVPKVTIRHEPAVETFPLSMSIDELMRMNRERTWALSREELMTIQQYFLKPGIREERKLAGLGEAPTDVEIEALAQTWSEHCKHKIFNAVIEYEEAGGVTTIDSLFKTYIVGSTEKIRARQGQEGFLPLRIQG